MRKTIFRHTPSLRSAIPDIDHKLLARQETPLLLPKSTKGGTKKTTRITSKSARVAVDSRDSSWISSTSSAGPLPLLDLAMVDGRPLSSPTARAPGTWKGGGVESVRTAGQQGSTTVQAISHSHPSPLVEMFTKTYPTRLWVVMGHATLRLPRCRWQGFLSRWRWCRPHRQPPSWTGAATRQRHRKGRPAVPRRQ